MRKSESMCVCVLFFFQKVRFFKKVKVEEEV